jgi:LTXXQ motif family protein
LEDVAGQALDLFNAWCTQKIPGTPLERVRETHARLSAVLRGVEMMRPVLARFYASLSDTQKAQLDAFASAETDKGEQSHAAAVACSGQPPRAPALPVGRIERELQANATQRAALRDFQSAILQARDMLQMRCPSEERSTLAGRFEQTWTRLNSLVRAVELVEPALATFYGLLEDDQKTRFNRIAQRRE